MNGEQTNKARSCGRDTFGIMKNAYIHTHIKNLCTVCLKSDSGFRRVILNIHTIAFPT